RALAAAVHERVPSARLPRLDVAPLLPLGPPPRRRPTWRAGALMASAAVLGLAVVLTWEGAPGPSGGAAPAPAVPAPAPVPAPVTAPPPSAVRVWPLEQPHFDDGVLTFGGKRYAVGQPGDVVVTGDWTCSGRPTVALLRPSSGQILTFERWADEDHEVPARPLGRVPGATGLRVHDADGDGCDDLEATRPGAPSTAVKTDGAAVGP
ncbi:MAG: hypothetical protein M3N68_00875, partial [Actinomycetota bacterium]|nr:hypothetical protein [Actinomycetota bacterium]